MTNPSSTPTTTPMPPPLPLPLPHLTLIVATTPTLGIGLRGTLPWPPLKPDLAFFARVTKRPPPRSASNQLYNAETGGQHDEVRNAVIMGRKTWESIPTKFRPLSGRINVVVTRQGSGALGLGLDRDGDGSSEKEVAFAVGSVEAGLRELGGRFAGGGGEGEGEREMEGEGQGQGQKEGGDQHGRVRLGRVFVIGGAEIYRIALGMEECERVLWTRLGREFECDTFFPPGVLEDGDAEGGEWGRKSSEELDEWTGEHGAGESKQEKDIEFRVVMMERKG